MEKETYIQLGKEIYHVDIYLGGFSMQSFSVRERCRPCQRPTC